MFKIQKKQESEKKSNKFYEKCFLLKNSCFRVDEASAKQMQLLRSAVSQNIFLSR